MAPEATLGVRAEGKELILWDRAVCKGKAVFGMKCWLGDTAGQGPGAPLGTREGLGLHFWGQSPTADPPPLPTGIIDLSQVPHLPVLVPPTPGTPATAIDRLAYLPTAPPPFSSRHSSSPLSPGGPATWVDGSVPRSLCPAGTFRPFRL